MHEDYTRHVGNLLWKNGPVTSVDHAQADNGWAFVDESVLDEFHTNGGHDLPSVTDCAGDMHSELKMKATHAVQPLWSLEQVIKSIRCG